MTHGDGHGKSKNPKTIKNLEQKPHKEKKK